MLQRALLGCLLAGCTVLAEDGKPEIRSLNWMSGCWTMSRGALTIEEHWSKPVAGNMLGYSRTMKGDSMVFHEYMRVEETKVGKVVYHARIGPQTPGTPFTLTRAMEGEAIFENPTHDFPQRILYKRVSNDEIHAQVDGIDKGKPRVQTFPMKRTACQ